jgi:hypothetical protein
VSFSRPKFAKRSILPGRAGGDRTHDRGIMRGSPEVNCVLSSPHGSSRFNSFSTEVCGGSLPPRIGVAIAEVGDSKEWIVPTLT